MGIPTAPHARGGACCGCGACGACGAAGAGGPGGCTRHDMFTVMDEWHKDDLVMGISTAWTATYVSGAMKENIQCNVGITRKNHLII